LAQGSFAYSPRGSSRGGRGAHLLDRPAVPDERAGKPAQKRQSVSRLAQGLTNGFNQLSNDEKRDLKMARPHPADLQFRQVSKKLLRASVIDIPELIIDRFAYNFGITQEKAFLLSNGAD
jgi:hypothetical protein